MLDRDAVPELAEVGAVGRAPAARLEPDQAAGRGGDADRAAAIVGVARRRNAGRHRRGRAAAGAAGRVAELPWVMGGAVGHRLGGAAGAALRRVGLGEDDQSGALPPRHHFAVEVAGPTLEEAAPAIGRHAGVGLGQVLEQEGHPFERPGGEAVCDRSPRLRLHRADDGIEVAVERLRRFERARQQLLRRHLAVLDERGQSQGIVGGIVRELHPLISRSQPRSGSRVLAATQR